MSAKTSQLKQIRTRTENSLQDLHRNKRITEESIATTSSRLRDLKEEYTQAASAGASESTGQLSENINTLEENLKSLSESKQKIEEAVYEKSKEIENLHSEIAKVENEHESSDFSFGSDKKRGGHIKESAQTKASGLVTTTQGVKIKKRKLIGFRGRTIQGTGALAQTPQTATVGPSSGQVSYTIQTNTAAASQNVSPQNAVSSSTNLSNVVSAGSPLELAKAVIGEGKATIDGVIGQGSSITSILSKGSGFSPQRKIGLIALKGGVVASLGAGLAAAAVIAYFAKLGAAAAHGAAIGATVGGVAGATYGGFLGFQVGVALAPFTFGLSIPIATAVGAALGAGVGATVGALAGGLIGLGVASGSATIISTGVGAGIGGVIGAVAGATLGAAAVAWIPFIGPFLAPFGAVIGATIGAAVGAAIGAVAGYYIGKYVLQPIQDNLETVTGSVGTASGGLVYSFTTFISWTFNLVGGFFSGLVGGAGIVGGATIGAAASLWNGAIGILGNATGALASIADKALGALSSLGSSVSSLTLPAVGTAFGTVVTVTAAASLITSATAFTPKLDLSSELLQKPGENDFFSITKTASPQTLSSKGPDVTFTISVNAKQNIKDIGFVENFHYLQGATNQPLVVPKTLTCTLPILKGDTCTVNFTFSTSPLPDNVLLINTVLAHVTIDNSANSVQDESATAIVKIGSPPTNCPSGWPTPAGTVTQGIQGTTSHYRLFPAEQAIDIAGAASRGTPTFTTFSGVVATKNDQTENPGYGYFVDVTGNCNGQTFTARWAHLESISAGVPDVGETINTGTEIGKIDATGHVLCDPQPCDPSHLHYSFFGLDMKTPYIPQDPIAICDGDCGVSW